MVLFAPVPAPNRSPEHEPTPIRTARNTLGVLCIGILILAIFWILRPFAGAAIWAVTIVVTTWSAMLRLQSLLWGRRSLAVAAMTLAWLVLLIAPVTWPSSRSSSMSTTWSR